MKTPFVVSVVVVMLFHNVYFDKQGNSFEDAIIKYGNEYRVISLNKSIEYIYDSSGHKILYADKDTAQVSSIDGGFYTINDTATILGSMWDAAPKTTGRLIMDELDGRHQQPH